MFTFKKYQKQVMDTAKVEDVETDVAHFGFGLAAEAGEISTIFQKYFRGDPRYYDKTGWLVEGDDFATFTPEALEKIYYELGDVLWHVAALAATFGMELDDIAQANISKLLDRKQRDVIHGDGDAR